MNESKGPDARDGRPELRRSVFDRPEPAGDAELDDDYEDGGDDDDEDFDFDAELDEDGDDDELDEEDDDDELDGEYDEYEDDEEDDEDDDVEPEGALPHWTEPPTSQQPALGGDDAWSALTGSEPRWRSVASDYDDPAEVVVEPPARDLEASAEEFFDYDEDQDVDDDDEDDIDFESLADDDLDDDDLGRDVAARAAGAEPAAIPITKPSARPNARPAAKATPKSAAARAGSAGATKTTKAGTAARTRAGGGPASKQTDMASRVLTGLVLAALAVAAFWIGPVATVALSSVVLGLCAIELSIALQRAGYQPATLLALVASVAAPIAVYNRGLDGLIVVLIIATAFSLLWFLSKAGNESPVLNAGVTVFTVCYIGLLGSFAALMLRLFGEHGIGMILAAVIGTIGHDIGALLIGRSSGRTKLTSVSPKKTREGLIGGMLVSIMAVVIFVGMLKLTPFGEPPKVGETFGLIHGGVSQALLLGLVIAITAPLGDLVESLIKRDLDVKDMSNLLRGHGGVLDRFDALLFTLPATYYLARFILM